MSFKVEPVCPTLNISLKEVCELACDRIKTKSPFKVNVVYVHDWKNVTNLHGYREYVQSANDGEGCKTIFLSWYSWDAQFELLSDYFTPERSELWDRRYCRHLQLPVTERDFTEAIKELISGL